MLAVGFGFRMWRLIRALGVLIPLLAEYSVGMPRAHGLATYVRDGFGALSQPKFECGCYEILIFRVCVVRQNFMCLVFTTTMTLMTEF